MCVCIYIYTHIIAAFIFLIIDFYFSYLTALASIFGTTFIKVALLDKIVSFSFSKGKLTFLHRAW